MENNYNNSDDESFSTDLSFEDDISTNSSLDDDIFIDIDFDEVEFINLENISNREKRKKRRNYKKNKKVSVFREILSYVEILIVAFIIAYVVQRFVIINAQVPTPSMTNTINVGDRLIGNKLAYVFSEPKRGDIIVFKYPDNETENYVKRLIGLPGDIVKITDGKVSVNGEELNEPYLKEPMNPDFGAGTYVVPEGHYFMLGDNRNNSKDSRFWENKYVSKEQIIAKIIFRYYSGPESKIKIGTVK